MGHDAREYSCPSAQPDSPDAHVFGIVRGTVDEPRVEYLEKGVSVSQQVLDAIVDVSPTRILRFAGKCANSGCGQFKDGGCRLGADILTKMDPVADRLPVCTIRATCRWYAENGRDVCLRCVRVVTTVGSNDATLHPIAIDVPNRPSA